MTRFFYTVYVDTDAQIHADQVLAERLGYDEDYGFDYTVDYRNAAEQNTVRKGDLYESIDGSNSLEFLHVLVKRVARDGSWADVQVTQIATGSSWPKRQPLTNGYFAFHTRLIRSER